MKKIFLIISLLVTVFAVAQLPTIPGVTKINQKYQWLGMIPPNDTIYLKWGWGYIMTDGVAVPYWGDGIMWHKGIRYTPINEQPGDNIITTGNGDFTNAPLTPKTGVVGSFNVIDNGNLNYTILWPQGYFIGGTFYQPGAGTTQLPVGTAGIDSGRVDLLKVTAAGAGSEQGDNSDNPQAPVPDLQTTIPVTTVLILSNDTVAAPLNTSTNKLAWNENVGPPGEATYSVTNVTANPNANIAGLAYNGTKYISITSFTANTGRINFTFPAALNKSDYSNVNGYIRINTAWNAATQYSVSLVNGAAVSNAVPLTTWGIVKTTTGIYQPFSIPMSAFTGSPQFTAIRITRTGTGGTVNWLLDYIQLQALGISSPTTGGKFGLDDITANENRNFNLNTNNTLNIFGGTTRLGHNDSVGAIINYSWATNPLSFWGASGSITTGSNVTAVAGAATLTAPIPTGVENWHFEQTIIPQTKASATNDWAFQLVPSSGSSLFTRKIELRLRDTAFYFNYYKNDGATTPDYTNRSQYPFIWSAGDTIDIKGYFRQGRMTFTAVNRANGSKSELYIEQVAAVGYYNIANIAVLQIKQTGASSSIKYSGSFKYFVDEPSAPDFAFIGDSHTIGSGAISLMYRWPALAMKSYSNTWIGYDGSGENSNDAMGRFFELGNYIKAKTWVWAYGTNDGGTYTAVQYATFLKRAIDSANKYGKNFIIVTPSPQATNMTTYVDSAVAIGARLGKPVVNIFRLLKAAAGTDRNTAFDYDGVHFNGAGNTVIASEFNLIAGAYLTRRFDVIVDNAPLDYSYDRFLALKEGKVVSVLDGGSGRYIKNLYLSNNIVDAQTADISVKDGRYTFINNGLPGTGEFIITGSAYSLNGAAFMQRHDSVLIANLTAGLFHSGNQYLGSNSTLFNTGTNTWANGVMNQSTDNFQWKITNAPGAVYGHTYDNIGIEPSNYIMARWLDNGTVRSYIDRKGGYHADTASGYMINIDYSNLSANDWITKNLVDSLIAAGGGGGGGTFVGLSDGPGSFSGNALKGVRVNAGATALEYYTTSGGSGADAQLSNLSGTVAIPNGIHLLPLTSGAVNLGSTSKPFGNLYLPNAGTIDFNSGASTITTTGTGGLQVNTGVTGFVVNGGSNAGYIGLSGAYSQISGNASDFYFDVAQSNKDLIFRIGAATERWRMNGTTFAFQPASDNTGDIGTSSLGLRNLYMARTITAGGTTGNQTINKPEGTVNIAAAGTTVTVTNSLVSATSIIYAVIRTNDATATIKNVVPASGSFVINLSAAATAEISIGFVILN